MPHKEPDLLILKLEAHLNHIETICNGSTLFGVNRKDRLYIVEEEICLMLALIQGAKES